MIFQHPDAVLNPGYTVGTALERALLHHGAEPSSVPGRIHELLTSVGLDPELGDHYPDELSGGQKRRIGICRALSTNPDLIIADEALSGLDVLLQEQILTLLLNEQRRRGFALILISHDLDRVNQVCDRALVMFGGRVVEDLRFRRAAGLVHDQFMHPYSTLLQRARIETMRREEELVLPVLEVAANPGHPRSSAERGCVFVERCDFQRALGFPKECRQHSPRSEPVGHLHTVACHFRSQLPMNAEPAFAGHAPPFDSGRPA